MAKSISSKLVLALTVCLAVILTLGMTLDYRSSRDQILERLRVESLEIVRGAVNDLEHWLQGVEGSTLFLARILEQRKYSLAGLDQMLRDIVAHNEDIYGATIALNPELGDQPRGFAPYYYHYKGAITYVDLAAGETNYWQQAWYRDAVEAAQPIWSEPYFDEGGAQVLMTTFSVPVYHMEREGKRSLYAVITADVALADLHYYLQRLHLGDSGHGMLFSREGIVLSSNNPQDIMRHYLDVMATPEHRDSWQRSFKAASLGELLVFPTGCAGAVGQCKIRLSTLTTTGWPVGFIYSEEELLAPLVEYQIKASLIGLLTLLLMALSVSIVSRRLTKPLVALALASDEIATGNLQVPLPRVQGEDEVARLVQSFGGMMRDLQSYIRDLEIASAASARLEGELAAAREIQMAMLPQGGEALEKEERYCLWAKVRPAKSVGGDLYTFYLRQGDTLFLAVGDVSDKGVPAALFMAKAMSHIQQYETAFESPGQGMALLNDALEQGNDNCMFVTLFFGVINLATLELCFASAGHTAPSLLRAGVTSVLAQQTGPALGLARNLSYPENHFKLLPGDRLAIYTDGIDEAFNHRAEMFGSQRLNTELANTGSQAIAIAGAAIFHCVDSFAGDTPQSDDITLMLVDFPAAAKFLPPSAVQSFPWGGEAVGQSMAWVENMLQRHDVDRVIGAELTLVTEEVITNINSYAQLAAGALIQLTVEIEAGNIMLEFSDQGIAFNPLTQGHRAILGADIESAEIGGLGVHLITQLTDTQSYRRLNSRNLLRVTKQFGKGESQAEDNHNA